MLKKITKKNIMLTIGIIWIMANSFYFNSYAKNIFLKCKPVGVMSTAVNQNVVVTWEQIKGADGYHIYEKNENDESGKYQMVKQVTGCKAVLKERIPGERYCYYVKAYQITKDEKKIYSKSSKTVSTTIPLKGKSTIKNLLQTAIAPMGTTMYVWGGGWNKEDTAAGKDARHTGLSSKWRTFASNKKASYNYRNYRYQIHDGLDCSGYVGWCVYNVLHTKNNQKGYVYSASLQAKKFADLGFGIYRTEKEITGYKAGDIMSSTCNCCGHVWIVVGECKDGSVVLIHSSPSGVQLSGTTTPSGKKNSEAYRLAKKYMKKYYKSWYSRFPNVSRGKAYLSHYGQMRWETSGEDIWLSDPDGYQNMSAGQILKDLFE